MNRFPEASQAGFIARWRNAARRPGNAETGSVDEPRRAHRSTSARRRLAGASGLFAALGLVAGMLQLATSLPASAAVSPVAYVVNTTTWAPAGGLCVAAGGAGNNCGLFTALTAVHNDTGTGVDAITFSIPAGSTITMTSADPTFNTTVSLVLGNTMGGAGNVIVNGNATWQPIFIGTGSAAVTIQNMTFTNGLALTTGGGGIYTNSNLTLNTVTVQNSSGGGLPGGGIYV
ncbi:MAG TPA: hypothetical protein VMR97_08380, partial [Acidimicrobiales bacterium]|nr:hypothetical protein [Acidimicrobiales bacterium]